MGVKSPSSMVLSSAAKTAETEKTILAGGIRPWLLKMDLIEWLVSTLVHPRRRQQKMTMQLPLRLRCLSTMHPSLVSTGTALAAAKNVATDLSSYATGTVNAAWITDDCIYRKKCYASAQTASIQNGSIPP